MSQTSAGPGAIVLTDIQYRIVVSNTTRQSADDLNPDQSHIVPSPVVLTGSPLFCLNFLHHLDFQIPLSQKFLKPGVLILKSLEFSYI